MANLRTNEAATLHDRTAEIYRLALESANLGTWVLDRESRILCLDERCRTILGTGSGTIEFGMLLQIVHPEDRLIVENAAAASNCPESDDGFDVEFRVISSEGLIRWVNARGRTFFNPSSKQADRVAGTATDITGRKQAELELRKAKSKLEAKVRERTRRLAEANKVLQAEKAAREKLSQDLGKFEEAYNLMTDLNTIGVFWSKYDPATGKLSWLHCNRTYLRILGYESEQQWSEEDPSRSFCLEADLKNVVELLLKNEKLINYKVRLNRRDGTTIWALLNMTIRCHEGKKRLGGSITDISSHVRIEERLRSTQKKLRAMASEIVLSDERSRQHFATDLHDTVVQTLGAAKLRAQLIEAQIPREAKAHFADLQDMLSQSITQARLIMAEMSPPVLYELGFVPALEWLTEQVQNQHNIEIDFQARSVPPLVHEIQVLLFQATRELLMNVVKHARARSALVKVSGIGDKVRIKVADDGMGIDTRQAFRTDQSSGGFGLFSIRERLKHFGGHMSIRSKARQGTTVIMTSQRGDTEFSLRTGQVSCF